MVIQEFGCAGFRNYQEMHLKFAERINLFFGKNGQGKSNLAEGIYFLNHLDSFRTHRFKNLLQFGSEVSTIQARIVKTGIAHRARIELTKKGRKVWLDDTSISKLSHYITEFYATVFNPDHLHGFRQFPHERRAYFDRYISFTEPNYLKQTREFRTVLAQKNRLLKTRNFSSLFDWNSLFVKRSHGIMQSRREVVEGINQILPELYGRLTGRQVPLRLVYQPSLEGEPGDWPEVLAAAREREARAGFAVFGPHRDDFHLSVGNGAAEQFFSQGEFRISLLAIKLVVTRLIEERKGFRPVLILDDLFSELDSAVKENLRQYLFGLSNQVFITSTEKLQGFGGSDVGIMEIRNGRVV